MPAIIDFLIFKRPSFKVGDLPDLSAFIPENALTIAGTPITTLATLYINDQLMDGNPNTAVLGVAGVLGALWLYGRLSSRELREGWILDKPWTSGIETTKPSSNTHWEITQHFKVAGIKSIVTETRSAQYRILKIPNRTPKRIKDELPTLSMMLGIDEKELKFIQNYQKGISAVLAPFANPNDWEAVDLNEDSLTKGKLIGYVGLSINGQHITYDRNIEPHLLIAGDTNSGKTEAIRADIQSMRLSGLNPKIYIIDPKEDMENEKSDFYTSDIKTAVSKLEQLSKIADKRKSKYSQAGCKNYFEYQRKVDANERPLMVYIDETADLLVKDLLEEKEEGEAALHERAFYILYYISRKNRAGGLFLTFGIQHPKATTLPTEIRNNLGAKLVLSMADETASKVALGKTGAETLPKFGAFMFKTSLTNAPIIGRGAYLQSS